MSKASSSTPSKTDWPQLTALQDEDIPLSDEPSAAVVQHIVRGLAR